MITPRTKAVIPVDLARAHVRLRPYSSPQLEIGQGLLEPGAGHGSGSISTESSCWPTRAHALGATYHGRPCGSVADFTAFSFHAVKNFTTAEGGGLAWRDHGFSNEEFYRQMMLLSLHGQTKDALAKNKLGAWEYDIAFPGWKCNMTDIQASLSGWCSWTATRSMLDRRRRHDRRSYQEGIDRHAPGGPWLRPLRRRRLQSSGHLMLVRHARPRPGVPQRA